MKKMLKKLVAMEGNVRACVWLEPLWSIPWNLILPFATVYMFELGVLDWQIGLIVTVSSLVQMVMALFGGIIADKFGRRWTTMVCDMWAWGVPMLIWSFSQNFWWFLTAAVINSFWPITGVSWECLWLDEADEKEIGAIYDWIHITGLLAVFFAPISGFFVNDHGVIPVMRILYLVSFVSMMTKFILNSVLAHETDVGKKRMAETKHEKIWRSLFNYQATIGTIVRSKPMKKALWLSGAMAIINMVISTFSALYITQSLGILPHFLAFFPILRAAIMLVFLFFVQQRLNRFQSKRIMIGALLLYALAMGILIAAPGMDEQRQAALGTHSVEQLVWVFAYVFLEASAAAILMPRVQAVTATAIPTDDRARISALFRSLTLGAVAPFGILAGHLSEINRRLPFVLSMGVLLLMSFMFAGTKNKQQKLS